MCICVCVHIHNPYEVGRPFTPLFPFIFVRTHTNHQPQGYLAGTGMIFKGGEALMETWTGKEGEAVNSAFGAFVFFGGVIVCV